LTLPPHGLEPSRGIRTEARTRSGHVTFLRLEPHSRVPPAVATPKRRTLTRFLAPTALPIREDLPLPGFAYPSHVASSHLPCASTLYSLRRLPGVLSTRCARGTSVFRACPNEDRRSFSARLPLLRLAYHSRVKQTVKPTHMWHLPENGGPRTTRRTCPKARPSQINDALTRYQR